MSHEPPALWKKRTNTGRVVYDRKKHYFKIKDVTNICIKLSNRLTDEEIRQQAIPLNALRTVIETGLWPVVISIFTKKPDRFQTIYYEDGTTEVYDIQTIIKRYYDAIIREILFTVSEALYERLANRLGVPKAIAKFIWDWMADWLFDVINDLIGPWIQGLFK